MSIPPRKDGVIWQHGNCKGSPHPRDENLRAIRKGGRQKWKRDTDYHRRSLAETTNSRLKAIFGGTVSSRKFANQAVELLVKCGVSDLAAFSTSWFRRRFAPPKPAFTVRARSARTVNAKGARSKGS